MGVKNQKFIKIPQSTEYINELGAVRLEDGRVIVRTYEDQQKTVAWTTDTQQPSNSNQLENSEIFKVTQNQINAGEIELAYSVSSGANVRVHQVGSIQLINAAIDEDFFTNGNFGSDKPDFRVSDQSSTLTIRASDLSSNIGLNDLIEVRYDVYSDQLDKIRQVIDREPMVEIVQITQSDYNQGYFLLSEIPSMADLVEIYHLGGIEQINRSAFTSEELELLDELPDFQVASKTATYPKAIYFKSDDYTNLSDEDISDMLSDKINIGDALIIYYTK